MSGPQPDEPNYFVLIAPGADSNDPTPAWTDVSTDLRSVSIRRGADKNLDEDQPGEATIVLDNFEGTYDNDNSGSPYAGLLITDMRVRVLAEWDGDLYERFNGYLDDIDLEYPDGDAEAWAVFHATDAFKVLAGTTLPVSVYAAEVAADAPYIWWRLDETLTRLRDGFALNSGSAGPTHNATFVASPRVGGQPLVVNDPGGSMETANAFAAPATPQQGTELDNSVFSLLDQTVFMVECWLRPHEGGTTQMLLGAVSRPTDTALHAAWGYFDDDGSGATGRLQFLVSNSLFTLSYGVQTANGSIFPGQIHHAIFAVETGGQMAIWLDGVRSTTAVAGTAATSLSGITRPSGGHLQLSHQNTTADESDRNWHGEQAEVAVYLSQLTSDRVAAHYAAGTAPWAGDTPGQRAGRICDVIGWPDLLRDFDDGESTLQSAELGQTALEHLLKVAASEFGELHVSKEGAIPLRERHSLINRDPLAELGPDTDDVRYRGIRFASGADLVRNPVTVSRLQGVAQTAEAAATYYPHQFTLDGLFHDSDSLSRSAAEFLLSEFKDQKRRITGLTFGPFEGERLFDWFPLLLEAELGDVYQVTFHPPNGDDLVQISVLEGTVESWSADSGIGEVGWSLSRAYAGSFWQLGVHGRSELGLTTRLYF